MPHLTHLKLYNYNTYAVAGFIKYIHNLNKLCVLIISQISFSIPNFSLDLAKFLQNSHPHDLLSPPDYAHNDALSKYFDDTSTFTITVPPTLREVYLNLVVPFTNFENSVTLSLPPIKIKGVRDLASITYTGTFSAIISYPIEIKNPTQGLPIHVDFSYNRLSIFHKDVFRKSISSGLYIYSLDLSYNRFGKYILHGYDMFQWMTDLKILNLSGNKISILSSNIFEGLNSVEIINLNFNSISSIGTAFNSLSNINKITLEGNQIQSIDFSLKGLNNLSSLSLENNGLVSLTSNFLEELDQITSMQEIILHGNPLDCCSCQYTSKL